MVHKGMGTYGPVVKGDNSVHNLSALIPCAATKRLSGIFRFKEILQTMDCKSVTDEQF